MWYGILRFSYQILHKIKNFSLSLCKHPYWYNMHKNFKYIKNKWILNIQKHESWSSEMQRNKYHGNCYKFNITKKIWLLHLSPLHHLSQLLLPLSYSHLHICFSTILMVSESPGYNGVLAQDPTATWALNVCGLVLCWRWLTSSLPTENARSASTEDAIQKV